ncbi:hypothetical protein D3C81_929490 [compost metagenome]
MAVGAIEGQLQVIRDHATHRQRLGHLQPVGQFLDLDLARRSHPGIEFARAAIGKNLCGDRLVERPCADVVPAQAFGAVETEITFELGQFQYRFGQFQACLGRLEVDENLRLLAFCQRNIQLQLALQVSLAFPAGKGCPGAYRRFLEDFQAIAQTAGKSAIEEQMNVLPGRHMGNVDVDIVDLGVEQLARAGQNPHAAVFDKHIAADLADMGPARLEGQFGIVNLEVQADAAIDVRGTVAERPLILEEALIHRALENRRAQPFVQCRAEDRRQVLGGVATVTVHQADPQVHVVFLGVIEIQANQEVAGDLAFLAQHFQIRRDQGETFFIEFPGQPRIGLNVLPWLGENRVQVQHEILAVHAQFAVPQVTADAAADISRRRRTVIGIETHLVEVGGKAELAVVGGIGSHVDQYIAQSALHLEPLDNGGKALRKRRQGI